MSMKIVVNAKGEPEIIGLTEEQLIRLMKSADKSWTEDDEKALIERTKSRRSKETEVVFLESTNPNLINQ